MNSREPLHIIYRATGTPGLRKPPGLVAICVRGAMPGQYCPRHPADWCGGRTLGLGSRKNHRALKAGRGSASRSRTSSIRGGYKKRRGGGHPDDPDIVRCSCFLLIAEAAGIYMSSDSVEPLHVFLKRCARSLTPNLAAVIPPEILNGVRPPTVHELVTHFPPMRVVFEFPYRGEGYFLRAHPMAGKASLLWDEMKTQTALVVDRDEPRSDVIILSGLKDEYKMAVRSLVRKCRAMSLPARDARVRRRPKKFVPSKNNILVGGGRVNPEANKKAAIAISRLKVTGSFGAPAPDEDSAS